MISSDDSVWLSNLRIASGMLKQIGASGQNILFHAIHVNNFFVYNSSPSGTSY
jgi:hypothetical protein